MPRYNRNGILGKIYDGTKQIFGFHKYTDALLYLGFTNKFCNDIDKSRDGFYNVFFGYDLTTKFFEEKIDIYAFKDKLKNEFSSGIYTSYSENFRKLIDDILNHKELQYYISYDKNKSKAYNASFIRKYSSEDLSKIKIFIEINREYYDVPYYLFLLIYLGIYKELPKDFYYGMFYKEDLEEFENNILIPYGTNSGPGTRMIEYFAHRTDKHPNIFALSELADMYYYGFRKDIPEDIVKAYYLYAKASGFIHKSLSDAADSSHCHPMALWSLGYIILNYHRPGTPLSNCDDIPDIEDMNFDNLLEQVRFALRLIIFSNKICPSVPATNSLGRIALISEDDIPGIDDLRNEYKLGTAEEYFKECRERGHVYSINNLAMIENERIFSDPKSRNEHLHKFLLYLEESSSQFEPWACNMLGEFYRTGVIYRRKNTVGPKIPNEYLDNYPKHPEKAWEYYKKATQYYTDKGSAWAYFNMLKYYPDKIIDNDLLEDFINNIYELKNNKVIAEMQEEIPRIYDIDVSKYDFSAEPRISLHIK